MIHRAQIDAHRKALVAAGIPPVSSMKGAALRQELSSHNLDTRGKVDDLRCGLQAAVDEQIKSGHVVLPTGSKGEFDWVVLRSGGLHWEMKLLQSVVEVLWPFVYREFAYSQGYTTDRQLEWAKGCKDHHRAYDELSRFTDGVFQELLYPYVHSCDVPTAAGFFSWAKQYSSNKTYTLLLQLTARCAFGVFVYRHGVRHNRPDVRRLGKRAVTPLIHARHHPNYQRVDLYDEEDELSYPSVLGNLLRDHWAFSRFVACEFSCRAVEEFEANFATFGGGGSLLLSSFRHSTSLPSSISRSLSISKVKIDDAIVVSSSNHVGTDSKFPPLSINTLKRGLKKKSGM